MLFNGTCRSSKPFEDKVKVNSLHLMEGLDKAYLMTTKKSPSKIMSCAPDQTLSFSLPDSIEFKVGQFDEGVSAMLQKE